MSDNICWRLFPIKWLLSSSLVFRMSECLSRLHLCLMVLYLPLVSYCFDYNSFVLYFKSGIMRLLALFFLFKITLAFNSFFWFTKSNLIFFLLLWIKTDILVEIFYFFRTLLLDGNPCLTDTSTLIVLSVTFFSECAFCPISPFMMEGSTCIELRCLWFLQILVFIKSCAQILEG